MRLRTMIFALVIMVLPAFALTGCQSAGGDQASPLDSERVAAPADGIRVFKSPT